jgi:hypothetical protein
MEPSHVLKMAMLKIKNKFDMMTSSAYQELKERFWLDGSFSSGFNLFFLLILS